MQNYHLGVFGSGFWVWGSLFRVLGLGFWVWGLGVQGFVFRVAVGVRVWEFSGSCVALFLFLPNRGESGC